MSSFEIGWVIVALRVMCKRVGCSLGLFLVAITLVDALFQPGQDLTLEPTDTAGTELNALGEEAHLLEPINVGWRVENDWPQLFL